MIPGPITSQCQPYWDEPSFTIESFDSLRYQLTVERENVPSSVNEHAAFEAEVARLEKIRREAGSDWEPLTVRLLEGDFVLERKIIA